jgi:hypothetical protein
VSKAIPFVAPGNGKLYCTGRTTAETSKVKGAGCNGSDDFAFSVCGRSPKLVRCKGEAHKPKEGTRELDARRPPDDDSGGLPPTCTGGALEGANNSGSNPASIEIADLRLHAFIVDPAFIDA